MRDDYDQSPELFEDRASDYQIGSSIIAILFIIILITLFVLPQATTPLIILSVVVLIPYLLGEKRGVGDCEEKDDERKEKPVHYEFTDF